MDVATFDLLVPSEESVVPTLLSRKIEPAAVGALLEHWVQVTDTSLHKEGATQALRAMLETGLDIYASNAFPLRRSR